MSVELDIQLDAEKHEYTVDGVKLPSVTEIIEPAKPYIPRDKLEAGAARGIAVHEACEFIDSGFEADIDPAVEGYAQGYKRFLAQTGAEVLKSEYRVANPPVGYAGTMDRLMRWQDEIINVDIKSGVIARWMGLQLAAYSYAYWLMTSGDPKVKPPKGFVLQLFEDGTYKLHEFKDQRGDYDVFLGLVRLWKWKEKQAA